MITSSPTIFQRDYWFGVVDTRPIWLFRICFGALLLKNALYLIPLAQLFFSDEGIVPRARNWPDPAGAGLGQFSIFDYVATDWQASILFGLWAAIALALLVGYRARTMAVLNFLFWLSLLHRNPYIVHGPDHVMMVLSFWLIFLPLNRRRGFAFPLRVIQLQVALIYVFTSYYKWQGLFWREGDALYYVLQQNSFLAPAGLWLAAAAPLWLLRLLTWSSLLIEMSFAVLVFLPVLQPWAKAAGLALAALLHLGIAVAMAIPDFSLVMMVGYVLFFEPSWVAWLEERWQGLVRLAPRAFPSFAGSARGVRTERELRGAQASPTPASEPAGFGAQASSPAVLGAQASPALIRAALAGLLALLLMAAIGGGLGAEDGNWSATAAARPLLVRAVNRELHLASPWTMFVYRSRPRTGWIMVNGRFENGASLLLYTSVDPLTGQISRQWGPAARLRFFEQRLLWSFPEPILRAWGAYTCRLYNRDQARLPGQRLVSVDIVRLARWSQPPGAAATAYADDLLWRQQCLGGSAVLGRAAPTVGDKGTGG